MSQKSNYYKIFGLTENASKNEIRKAYRKLAMQFHPDKNSDPKAHQLFIDLTEAYEYLLEEKPHPTSKIKKETTFEERKKQAEFRYKQHQERQKREQDLYFTKLTSGKKWKFFKYASHIGLLLSLILLIEPFLPTIFEKHQIIAKSNSYSGLMDDQVVCIKTDRNLSVFVVNPYYSMFSSHSNINIERSLIFHNPVKVWCQTIHFRKGFDVDFSAINLYPIIPILFAIPFFVFRFKRKSYWFTFGLLASQFLIFPCMLWFLCTQDRWVHLLCLGLI